MLLFLFFVFDLIVISSTISSFFGGDSYDTEFLFSIIFGGIFIAFCVWGTVNNEKAKKKKHSANYERPKLSNEPLSPEEMEKFQLEKKVFRRSYWLIVAIEIIIALLCIIARFLIGR